jgi:hypothetical protein
MLRAVRQRFRQTETAGAFSPLKRMQLPKIRQRLGYSVACGGGEGVEDCLEGAASAENKWTFYG